MKDAERCGSAGSWSKACIAADARGDCRSFQLRERGTREAGDRAGFGLLRSAGRRCVLREVCDECSVSDFAGCVGFG